MFTSRNIWRPSALDGEPLKVWCTGKSECYVALQVSSSYPEMLEMGPKLRSVYLSPSGSIRARPRMKRKVEVLRRYEIELRPRGHVRIRLVVQHNLVVAFEPVAIPQPKVRESVPRGGSIRVSGADPIQIGPLHLISVVRGGLTGRWLAGLVMAPLLGGEFWIDSLMVDQ